jgi:hypothetical protein
MPRDDPFAGIPLSEQAQAAKLEQRLFEPGKSPTNVRPRPPAVETKPPSQPKPPSQAATNAASASKAPSLKATRFDLADMPINKMSFLMTPEEFESLEDLKLELRRDLDTKVTKNDLIRCALHMLIENYVEHKDASYASRKIRKR